MNELVREWLIQAEKDLKAIKKTLEDPDLTNIAAFHSQQSIEKAFKALILNNHETIPKIHNLIKLYGMIKNQININFDMKVLERINETYIDSRYPSEMGLLPEGQPSVETVEEFYGTAIEIFSQIKIELEK